MSAIDRHATGGRRPLVVGPLSTLIEPRVLVVGVVLSVTAVGLFALSLVLGDFAVPLGAIVPSIRGDGPEGADFVIGTLRLPRALTAALVGAAFGLSGAIFQRVTGNALASPDIVGINAGASAGAVATIVILGASTGMVTVGALAGGLLTALAVYLLTRADITDATRATVWLTGSLNARGWDHVLGISVALAVLVPLALSYGRGLRALQLGDDAARGLGVRTDLARGMLLLVAVLLAAVATASAGPIAFVALASAPIAKRLAATGGIALVPALLTGACILLGADLVAQHLLGGLPVGIATALVGAPYLLFLLSRADRIGAA